MLEIKNMINSLVKHLILANSYCLLCEENSNFEIFFANSEFFLPINDEAQVSLIRNELNSIPHITFAKMENEQHPVLYELFHSIDYQRTYLFSFQFDNHIKCTFAIFFDDEDQLGHKKK